MKFRLTIGADGSPWGSQEVLQSFEAQNAVEFAVKALVKYDDEVRNHLISNAWIDAGANTLPIAVMNLVLD